MNLGDKADAPGKLAPPIGGKRPRIEENASPCGRKNARESLEEARLPRTIRSDEGQDLAAADCQRQTFDRSVPTIGHTEPLSLERH